MFFIGLSVGFILALICLVFLVGRYNNRNNDNKRYDKLTDIHERNLEIAEDKIILMRRIAVALEEINNHYTGTGK